MMRKYNRKGITLIEMVSIIVVLGMSIPVLLTMWADVAWRSSRSEVISDGIFYAQQLMEEIKSKAFDESAASPWTNSVSFGPDAGEVYPNYDDADDFNNYSDAPASGFSRTASVRYIYLSGSDWQACPLPVNCVVRTNCSTCAQCCYKQVTVNVSRNVNLAQLVNLNLVTVVSGQR